MVRMLIVVLTTNESADKRACDDLIEINMDTLVGLIDGITISNVVCVSLEDLRSKATSDSHVAVQELLSKCQALPLEIIDSLAAKYEKTRKLLLDKTGEIHAEVKEIVNDGWTAYEDLTDAYESASHTKIASVCMDGFVYKRTSALKTALAIASLGTVNLVRKFAIHVELSDSVLRDVLWENFVAEQDEHSPDAMRVFGDKLYSEGLAVLVRHGSPTRVGTLHVQRSYVTVFNPELRAQKSILDFFQEI